ncbi:MAG TPA: LPS assembly protein LptD [Gammaproteobacteria bacterium]
MELPTGGEIFADANSIETLENNVSRLTGDVVVLREFDRLQAEEAFYDPKRGRFELFGDVRHWSGEFEFLADSITTAGNGETGELHNAQFFIASSHLTGQAERIERRPSTTWLYNSSYTTCDPDNADWRLRGSEIKLDHAEGQGLAKHMRLYFKGIPIFYFPALSFPIDDRRKSGFLYPEIGDSNSHGFELATPYYWNIAPNIDATLTPHQMSRRGLKLDTEWRYLNNWSTNQLDTEYLDDAQFGDSRSLVRLTHNGKLGNHWRTRINATSVSDEHYFDNFGGDLAGSSITHLPSNASLTGNWQHWTFSTRLFAHQTLDETIPDSRRPYDLLPEVMFKGLYPEFWGGFDFELDGIFTKFDQTDRVTATRANVIPTLSRPMGGLAWFLVPSLSVDHAEYRLENLADPQATTSPNRTVPIFSMDSGLFFERQFGNDQRFLQTLEPRLFYLRVPFRDQSEIPIFDTSLPDFNFMQLFSENRFIGADRIGDANQATLSLTTRFLSRLSGKEFLRAGIGQIHYFEDREVTLPGRTADIRDRSNLIGEINANLGDHWSSSLMTEWDPELEETDKKLFRLRYNRGGRYIANLSYRFREQEQLEQADISFAWQFSPKWSFMGRWNQSLPDKVNLEKFLGVIYENCCYAVRLVYREYLTGGQELNGIPGDDPHRYNDAIFIQLSLKGLAGIGSDPAQLLERGIPGYRDPFN